MGSYFDHNATTPMSAVARETWLKVESEHWQNPSSLYAEAAAAKRLLEDLREELADRLGCAEATRVVFTSGATEANNAVMRFAAAGGEKRVVISAIEHPSVYESARDSFAEVTQLPVSSASGVIDADALAAAVVDDGVPALVSVMAANNETGVLQPWRDIAAMCREAGVRFHCDAAQWFGKLPAESFALCDFVSGSAHKFGGPKGVGFLLLPEATEMSAFKAAAGGPQENRHRAGTEDLPGIAAMMAALREHDPFLSDQSGERKAQDRDAFEDQVTEAIAGCRVIADDADRLWNTSMLVMPEHNNLKWLTRLSRRGFSVSTGSACSAGRGNPSNVMAAMGLDHAAMGRVIRISGGWDTGAEDWRAMASALNDVGRELDSGQRDGGGLSGRRGADLFGSPS